MANVALERVFYNEELKKRYLSTIKQYSNIERMFLKSAKYEQELDKDASLFSVKEVQDMLKRMSFHSYYSFSNFRSQMSRYTDWCMRQNIVSNYFNNYEKDFIGDASQYINPIKAERKIISRPELLSALDKLDNACDAFAILAMFEGINGKNRVEINNLRTTDINIENNTVDIKYGTPRVIKISDKLIDLAFSAADAEKYTALSGRQVVFANDPTLIFKEFNNSQEGTSDLYKGRRLYFRLVKCLSVIGFEDLSVNSISDSGKIHMINEIAEKENLSGKQVLYIPELLNKVEKQFGQNLTVRKSSFLSNYEEYLE